MQILNDWNKILEEHISTINNFLVETKHLHKDYSERTKNRTDIGFNVFKLTSDLYYRENFHSDLIKSFLDPQAKHNEGNKYLHYFIDLLNQTNNKTKIIKDNFNNSTVEREKYYLIGGKRRFVDILITDEVSKNAIIIENKINNADDRKKQLPDYMKALISDDFKVVAIVYLTLNSSKRPDKSDWNKDELKKINSILRLIPAFDIDKSKPNLFDNWIIPCIINSTNIDSSLLLRQYGNLIKYLNTNTMDTVSLEKFYNSLKENDNLKTAISIRNMLNELPEYLAIRIEEKYKNNCYPFKKIWRYKQRDTVFEGCEINDLYLKLDIWCDENGYTVHFWRPNVPDYDISKEFKNKLDILKEFSIHNNEINNIKRHFDIFEEDKLFDFIDNLLEELKKIKENKE